MPRGSKHQPEETPETVDTPNEDGSVQETAVRTPRQAFKVDAMPKIHREGGGRERIPTDFDDLVVEAYEDGEPRAVEYTDDDDLKSVQNELKRALKFRGFGADRVARDGVLYFTVRDRREIERKQDESAPDEDSADVENSELVDA